MHPCPNQNNARVSRAYGYQRIHAQTIIPFVFREHTVTSASMAERSCSDRIRSPEHPCPNDNNVRVSFERIRSPAHPCPNHNNVRVSRIYGHQSIHAQTIITFVFREHMVTSASRLRRRRGTPLLSSQMVRSSTPRLPVLFWFGHGCTCHRMLSKHERFGHGCTCDRMLSKHERYYGLGAGSTDALVGRMRSKTDVIMARAWAKPSQEQTDRAAYQIGARSSRRWL